MERRQLLSLPNGGFESGDLSGWANPPTQYGIVATNVTSHQAADGPAYAPVEGTRFALLPSGYGGRPTSLSKDFHAEAGDTIRGWAFFDAGDTLDIGNDDSARVTIKAGTATVATPFSASVSTVGNFGQTPWTQWSYTFTEAGNYRVEATCRDDNDPTNTSYLGLDAVEFTGTFNPGQPQVLTVSADDQDEGSATELSGVFQDATPGDRHQVVIDWGDGTQTIPLAGDVNRFDVGPGYLNPASGHAYYAVHGFASWAAAEARAQELGGHLLTINDAAEQDWVWRTIAHPSRQEFIWLGLNDAASEGSFAWASGEAPQYTNWAAGQPDDASPWGAGADYAALDVASGGVWVDIGDLDQVEAIIELAQPLNTEAPGLNAFYAEHVYLHGAPAPTGQIGHYPVTVTVTDAAGLSSTATTSIMSRSVGPTVNGGGPSRAVPGQAVHYAYTVSDSASGSLRSDWQVTDGTAVVASGSGTAFDFTPVAPGFYYAELNVLNESDGDGTTVADTLIVEPAQVQEDPGGSGRTIVAVGGTTRDDAIVVRGIRPGTVQVLLNGASLGTFSATGGIRIYGQSGDDHVLVLRTTSLRVTFFGGDGDDTLNSPFYGDVLFGGAGRDRALGRARLIG
jgi:hypothetical protein